MRSRPLPSESKPTASPLPLLPGLPSFGTSEKAEAVKEESEAAQLDEDLKVAKRERRVKLAALREGEERVKTLERAIDIFERDLVSTRELLGLAKKAVEADEGAVRAMETRLAERRAAGELEEELSRLTARRDDVRRRLEAGAGRGARSDRADRPVGIDAGAAQEGGAPRRSRAWWSGKRTCARRSGACGS